MTQATGVNKFIARKMLNVLKQSGRFSRFFNTLEVRNSQLVTKFRPYTYLVDCCSEKRSCGVQPSASFLTCTDFSWLILSRNKHAGRKTINRKQGEDEESSDDEQDEIDDDDNDKSGVVILKVTNSRLDVILKRGLKLPRRRIKEYLYEDRIRVNGMRVPKVSHTAIVGDQIDVVHDYKPDSNSLIISQIKFSKANIDMNTGVLVLELQVFKNLAIKNYSNEQAFKGSSQGN